MEPLRWHVGDVIRKLRERRHWTQPKLAEKASLNKATIVALESNEGNPKRDTYEAIARAFGLSVGDLFSLVPGTEPTKEAGGTAQQHHAAPEDFPPSAETHRAKERR